MLDTLPVNVDGIPLELRRRRQWVCWRLKYIEPEGDRPGRWTKPPIDPHIGGEASSTNSATWGTLAEALARMERDGLPGIGYVVSEDDPYTGIDLDKCRDPLTGQIAPWAETIIRDLDSYAELSPTETGVHVFVRASKPGDRCRRGKIELYDRGRYFTMTGQRL